MRFQHRLLILIPGILFHLNSFAQERCGFNLEQEKSKKLHPTVQEDFEKWMSAKIRQRANLRTQATFEIPVVVHIIHNGEPVGTETNLSEAQILSQIDVLNDDYQRLNADKVNTPAEFSGVAAGIDIEFVLARQDPEGLPTNGIVRVQGNKSGWTYENAPEFKSQSYWPAEDYLNIWVVNFTDDYLGFAQFPITTLPGVEGPFDRLTDGVVCDYTVFGTVDAGAFELDPQYNKGRTATHEVGHYLGLIHIFGGEGSCNTTDFVNDTPSQSSRTLTCATHPTVQCGHNKMFQNYMDYTDDACMNLFTSGQFVRVTTVLQNSPRRNTLSTSHGLNAPTILALDLEARRVVSPFEVTCGQDIVPKVELRNRGTTTITSAQIQLSINGVLTETKSVPLNLTHLAVTTVSFTTIDLPETGTSNVTFQITQINGGNDLDANNNSTTLASSVMPRSTVPFTEPFNITPSTWQVINKDNDVTWVNVQAPKTTANNRAMRMENYFYENTGSIDQLVTNAIELTSVATPVLKFDRAYAQPPNNNSDILRVRVSTGCSTDLSQAVEIFKKSGTALATASQTNSYFTPTGDSQWLTENISLAAFAGKNVQLIFETTNGYGNNLYLDNVTISGGEFNDVAINSILTPSGPVFCVDNPAPVIQVQNLGSTIVNTVRVTTELDGLILGTQTFQSLNLVTGGTAALTLNTVELEKLGEHSVKFTISNPNAVTEESPTNNSLSTKWVLNTDNYASPLRMNLDNGIEMSVVNPKGGNPWQQLITIDNNNSLVYEAYDNPNVGEQSWAVTPTIDLSATTQGSLFFDTSYGSRSTGQERLRVLVSEDCGMHFTETIFDAGPAVLANQASENDAWAPELETDWTTHYLSLNDIAGKDQVRFAFVVDNGHGNNLFLDNLEWFIEDDPSPPRTEELFTVYSSESNPYDFFITFNLPEKNEARLVVYNLMGQVLIDNILPASLNQTYTVNLFGQSTGIYLVRLHAGGAVATTKLFVGK